MFFDSVDQITSIAKKTGCAIFVMPSNTKIDVPGALILGPVEKTTITIEQVREVILRLNVKQVTECFVMIRPADKLGEEAANAFLKNLEEPGEKVHFILITDSVSKILPTIVSRSAVYFLKAKGDNLKGVDADVKVKELAKRLMTASSADLPSIVDDITKKKDGVRNYALEIVGVSIEMLYKSYLITGKEAFLKKVPNLS